jgi:hypothetical protein
MIIEKGGHQHWWQVKLDVPTSFYKWEFNAVANKIMSVHAAADYTANLIAQKYNNLYLLMSGGIDSEYVAEVLYRNKIPFTPIIGTCSDSGDQSYFYAIHWCEQRSIQPLVIDYQLDDMRLQKAYAKAIKTFGITSRVYCVTALIDEVLDRNGHILLGDPNLILEKQNSKWDDPIGDLLDVGYHAFFGTMYTKGTHPCEFFSYTPELLLALIRQLDTQSNISVAKSKLYDLPLKIKTWPTSALTDGTRNKILKLCHALDKQNWLNDRWQQQELIKLLTRIE